ncbi:RagB/SusD family nutrient uptake outer membrane protein [Labilibacter sediminis]|nr:RagB/SusD family nutrient uptake outer membrane protein [Labilibacter sediminis]
MKYLNYIIIVTVFLFYTSCEDFLEEEPITSISSSWIYENAEGYATGVNALYHLNRSYYEGTGQQHQAIPTIMSDLVGVRAGFGSWVYYNPNQLTPTSASFPGNYIWTQHYRIIDRSNALIASSGNFDENIKPQEAEARMFRAHSYFTLYRLFHNLHLNLEPTTPENAFDIEYAVASPADIFNAINDDLDSAIVHLPWTTDNVGRWTKATAKHLKAKVALWQSYDTETQGESSAASYHQQALSQAEDIIGYGVYELAKVSDVFGSEKKPTKYSGENLFVINFDLELEGSNGGGRNHRLGTMTTARYQELKGVVEEDFLGQGLSWAMPSNYLLNLYGLNDSERRKDKRFTSYYVQNYYYNDSEDLPDGAQLGEVVSNAEQKLSSEDYYRRLHPSLAKYIDFETTTTTWSWSDIIVYRLAETYLIAAEASLLLEDYEQGVEYLNQIRRRAYDLPIAEKSSIDFSSADLTLDLILDERARELAMEGQRWYTLKRTGKLIEYMRDHAGHEAGYTDLLGGNLKTDAQENIQLRNVNFPIPQNQIDIMGVPEFQNEGY